MRRLVLLVLMGASLLAPGVLFARRGSYDGNPYERPQRRNYENGGHYRVQEGYTRENGTTVRPHIKTTPDNSEWNNAKPQKGRMGRF